MAGLIFFLGLFLFFGADSPAQVYKYTDEKGTVCLTDNPPPSPVKDAASDKEQKPREVKNQTKGSQSRVKDILEMGREVLEKELAKPPEKQDQRLIKEMTEILYGDVSGKKSEIKRQVAPQQPTENSFFSRTLRYIDNLISFRK
jgi:hypothetical protein